MLQGEGRERPIGRLLVGVSTSGLGLITLGAWRGGADGAAWGLLAMQTAALAGVAVLLNRDPPTGG